MDGAGRFTGFAVSFTLYCLCGEGYAVRGAEVGTNDLKQEEVGWATEALSALE